MTNFRDEKQPAGGAGCNSELLCSFDYIRPGIFMPPVMPLMLS